MRLSKFELEKKMSIEDMRMVKAGSSTCSGSSSMTTADHQDTANGEMDGGN